MIRQFESVLALHFNLMFIHENVKIIEAKFTSTLFLKQCLLQCLLDSSTGLEACPSILQFSFQVTFRLDAQLG